ncbi:LysR family transcriptional regulator [Rhizobium rhizogenes]|uniref:LysR family transcriptional regulator n=1 Tax=Rhizobium rhizogenes TaxID=359 RepID=UPI000AFD3684|nr:LysR family transcriptional regulator [Rhizobium rhizogenes]
MHDIDWNDLRYVLAVARGRSFAAASREIKTDATTVGRRLRTLEERLGVTLFQRDTGGVMTPTPAGEIAVARAEAIEAEVMALSGALEAADVTALGKVRLTAPPSFISRLLIPVAAELLSQHSGLQLELIGDARNFNLTRREADMAIRLARPADMTNSKVVARRIATLDYAIYVAAGTEDHAENLPWLVYEEGMMHLPHARWIAAQAEKSGGDNALAVNDAEALLQAAVAGLGRALLPTILVERVEGLSRVDADDKTLPVREVWLLTHAELRNAARIRAVAGWLDQVFQHPKLGGDLGTTRGDGNAASRSALT